MKSAGYLAIVGGILLLLGGAVGSALPAMLFEYLKDIDFGDNTDTVHLVFRILILLAALGGLTVIGGGYAITKDFPRIGKVLIFLGCAFGFIGLIINALIAYFSGTWDTFIVMMMGTTGIGSVLAIVAYMLA